MSGYVDYVTKPGDRWDLIAYAMYGDPTLYSVLIDANRAAYVGLELAAIPPVLEAGLTLRAPVLDAVPLATDAPPWRRQPGDAA